MCRGGKGKVKEMENRRRYAEKEERNESDDYDRERGGEKGK
jgi:hypothetical protein